MTGELVLPERPTGVVVLVHGTGPGHGSPVAVADELHNAGIATLAMDPPGGGDRPPGAADVVGVLAWLGDAPGVRGLPVGLYGAGSGATAVLAAAAEAPRAVAAVVACDGRPDPSSDALGRVRAPTLLIVSHDGEPAIGVNTAAVRALGGPARLHVLAGPPAGAGGRGDDEVAALAREWFRERLARPVSAPSAGVGGGGADPRSALQGLIFFPRGGSAQVVRHLARELPAAGWRTRVVAGSLGARGDPGHAASFFGPEVDLTAVPYDRALTAPVPVMASPPMHPSYEDRPGAPDRVMAGLDDAAAEHLATEWTRILGAPGLLAGVEVAHLHHLTSLHEAVARLRPGLPVVTHIHGTELLMLDEAERGASWPHAAAWRARMRGWAAGSTRVITSSEPAARDAERILGVDPDRVVVVPNGVDLSVFVPRRAAPPEREALFRRWLCEEPRGWSPRHPRPGGVRYAPRDLAPLLDPDAVVVLYVGRFTAVKRAALLVRAHARARALLGRPLPLVFAGGAAGEWEGEHPADAVARSPWGHEVFMAGWRSHHELAEVLACVEVMAVPSVAERFGQVYIEAMAMGVPVIACRAAAPPTFIDDDPASPERCGWLVEPDDEEDLARALVAAARHPDERALRGANGRRRARSRFSVVTVARAVADVYATAASA